jgi:hypothetical protein
MTIAISVTIGLLIGATIGALFMAALCASKVSDLQDQVDAYKTSRWPS